MVTARQARICYDRPDGDNGKWEEVDVGRMLRIMSACHSRRANAERSRQ